MIQNQQNEPRTSAYLARPVISLLAREEARLLPTELVEADIDPPMPTCWRCKLGGLYRRVSGAPRPRGCDERGCADSAAPGPGSRLGIFAYNLQRMTAIAR